MKTIKSNTKTLNKISAVFFFVLGFAVLYHGTRLGLKVNLDMGPGFFPAIVGGILLCLSLILLLQSILAKDASEPPGKFWVYPGGWKSVFLTLFTAAAYPFSLYYLGFLISTFLLLFFLLFVIAHYRWWLSGIWGIGTSVVAYLIFELWLKANLPKGILIFY